MPALTLRLESPADGTRVLGAAPLRLAARIEAPPAGVALHVKWYSSAAAQPLGTVLELPAAQLPLGSQVVTVAAKDQAGDDAPALAAVVHAGLAGGPEAGGSPCRVHVLRARLFVPAAGASLARGAVTIEIESPPRWARRVPPAVAYELDPEYQALNKLRFRLRLAPLGAPAGRGSGELVPAAAAWIYVEPPNANAAPRLRYSGPLPAGLGTGSYRLTLRVEHADDAASGHQQAVDVVLT